MRLASLLAFIHAAHHTWLVESPWEERGGILLVAPPGQMKTTSIYTLDCYAEVLPISDLNVRSLKSIRDNVLSGRYKTLAFGEIEKLYARNPATAVNIEAHLKQFIEEGMRHFSHEDSSSAIMPARALVIAGITPSSFAAQFTRWRENGFIRRFIRFQYTMGNEHALLDAVHHWKKIGIDIPTTWNGKVSIKYNLDESDSKFVMKLMQEQPEVTSNTLLKKIAVVLKRRSPDTWKQIISDVAPAFGKNGAILEL